MEKIQLNNFAELIGQDEALRQQLQTQNSPEAAMEVMERLAGEMGYELELPPTVEALSDDALANVAGGFDTGPADDPNLNPYSWFVTLFRRLIRKEDL